jgi:Flp pilus assembly pilin Flp
VNTLQQRGKSPLMSHRFRAAVERDEGQTMVEYAVVLGVITLAIVTSFGIMAGAIQNILGQVAGFFS